MTTTDCPPLPVRITKSLLGYGVIAGPIYVLAVAVQMAVRDGFDPGMGEVSWHGLIHLMVASIGFACLVAACFVLAAWFARAGEASWVWFSRITGVVFAASFLALASGSGGAATILVFTGAVMLVWAWLSAVSIRLYRGAGEV